MRTIFFSCLIAALLNTVVTADEPASAPQPLVEKYLASGELSQGVAALEASLQQNPSDDQLRFGLGLLQLLRGVERLGQSLYDHGSKSDVNVPFLRLPVPENPSPAKVSHQQVRRMLDDFQRDLSIAENSLAAIKDENVKLPVLLKNVRMDIDGDGKPTDELIDVIQKITRQRLNLLVTNPNFRICLDRGDVAWLRAYCHLLMAMLDGVLAFDGEHFFNGYADQWFAEPVRKGGKDAKGFVQYDFLDVVEPARLSRLRYHLLQVCELNHETWKYIRAETDDDDEWLPNSKQKGVLGMPVRDEMVDQWLTMITEMESLLNGKKLVPIPFGGKFLNLRKLLDEPPAKLDLTIIMNPKYLEDGDPADATALTRAFQQFDDPLMVGYVAWFN